MIPSLSIGPSTLLNDCNHSATAIFWRSAILWIFARNRAAGRPTAPLTAPAAVRPTNSVAGHGHQGLDVQQHGLVNALVRINSGSRGGTRGCGGSRWAAALRPTCVVIAAPPDGRHVRACTDVGQVAHLAPALRQWAIHVALVPRMPENRRVLLDPGAVHCLTGRTSTAAGEVNAARPPLAVGGSRGVRKALAMSGRLQNSACAGMRVS